MAVRRIDEKKSKKIAQSPPREQIGSMVIFGLRPGIRKAA